VFRSIIVGTDGSETAKEAVRHASEVAKRCGARVHLVSAQVPTVGAHLAAGTPVGPEMAGLATGSDRAGAILEEAAGAFRTNGVSVELHAPRAEAADALIEVAEREGADLIVVGNKGMSGARRFFLGSVPNKVTHHAPCSVMIVNTSR
jgi:nucleotide-binding universal stress UspA family protein